VRQGGQTQRNVNRMTSGPALSILVVSYYFPPDGEVGGKRIARFCQYLPDHGIYPTVLTIDEESCRTFDPSLRSSEKLQIARARPDDTILDWYYRRTKSRTVPGPAEAVIRKDKGTNPLLHGLRRHLLSLHHIPDSRRGWYRPALKQAARIIANTSVDAVFSSGPPWTAHAVGHAISRRYNLPWLADFRDAWAADPWRKYTNDSAGLPIWRDWFDMWIEDRWVRRAALVICTTSRQRDSLLQFHPHLDGNRVAIVSNGLDDVMRSFPAATRTNDGPRILLHAGSLYAGRGVDAFCRAIASLVRAGQLSADNTRIILMGDVDPDIEYRALNSAPELFGNGMISFCPRVEWEKAQERLWKADVLLIFQGHHSTAIPAKFFEYLKTGKPILALTSDGALRDIVLSTGSGSVAHPDDQTEIASAIIQALRATPRTPEEVERVTKQFDFRYLTAELAANIRRALR
jgi:glycosyltransferase involved in cell wall biosynthesis